LKLRQSEVRLESDLPRRDHHRGERVGAENIHDPTRYFNL